MPTKILIVDDEAEVLRTVSRFLESQGYGVRTSSNVDDALETLEQEGDISVVISDFGMPKKSGVELLRAIRNHPERRNLPVIIESGSLNAQARKELEAFGPQAVLEKPVPLGELLDLVRMLTTGR